LVIRKKVLNLKQKFYKNFFLKEKNKNIIDFEQIKKLYDEYLEFGGFPQVVLEERSNRKKQWLQDIFRSYFEKDVQTLTDFKNISIFQDLLMLLLQRVGSKLEISKISSEVGVIMRK